MLAAAARFVGAAWRFDKRKGKGLPIDAVVALAMAVRVLDAAPVVAAPEGTRMPSTTPAFT